MPFSIDELKRKIAGNVKPPKWKQGRIEAGSPTQHVATVPVRYIINEEGTAGRFRLKEDPENDEPGAKFELPGDRISGWQQYHQKLYLESGERVYILQITRDGRFETSSPGEALE